MWDSTYFGQYYEKIKNIGFSEKEERKGVQFQLTHPEANPIPGSIAASQTITDQVIFKNNEKGQAIILGKFQISFHIVRDYKNWEDFLSSLIEPFMKMYIDLGLGNGPRQCTVIYLNNFVRPGDIKLNNYFTLVSELDPVFGLETSTFVQRIINNGKQTLISKIVSNTLPDNTNVINLECGAACANIPLINSPNWLQQANETREPVRNFFEAIITQKLRDEL